jgi:superfamily II DNA/RNA helicase
MQITEQAKLLASNSNSDVTSFSLIGEVNIQKQIKNIKSIKPHIVVATSGRALDLIQQRKLKAHTIKTIILDEVDSLLSGNNVSVIKDIIKTTLRDRQLLGFSASLNETTLDILNNIMKEPEVIKINEEPINPNINHMYLHGDRRDKFTLLRKALSATNPKRAIVFVNDENSIEVVTAKLNYHNYKAIGIHGKMIKEDRKNALNSFKIGKSKILVSSDLSARGLDIVDVTHVFNLDFPPSKNEYIHRCGRTARGNRKGDAISIVTNQNLSTIRDYKRNFNIDIKKKELKEGKLIDASFKQTRKSKNFKTNKPTNKSK